jgi:GH25 family lysozyme M1 (1,4-beta-N-acetylmuramidase)
MNKHDMNKHSKKKKNNSEQGIPNIQISKRQREAKREKMRKREISLLLKYTKNVRKVKRQKAKRSLKKKEA